MRGGADGMEVRPRRTCRRRWTPRTWRGCSPRASPGSPDRARGPTSIQCHRGRRQGHDRQQPVGLQRSARGDRRQPLLYRRGRGAGHRDGRGRFALPGRGGGRADGFNVDLPVAAGDTPQDFGLDLRLAGVTISDMLWGIFDPADTCRATRPPWRSTWPGRPVTATRWTRGDGGAGLGETLPAELGRSLNGLEVSAAGRGADRRGRLHLRQHRAETFNGMPAPSGEVNLELVGGNTLLDTLVGMGLVPEERPAACA